ncbi:MAG TPA: hypothetical protein VGK94_14475 [Candidatus Polarisedimenticolia bacterium]|jgi:hypothetical protein
MNRSIRRTLSPVFLLPVALFFLPVPMQASPGDVGRSFARCIQACVAARQACNSNCETECKALFPGPNSGRGACMSQCVAVCIIADRECRTVCHAIKDGNSPEDPG